VHGSLFTDQPETAVPRYLKSGLLALAAGVAVIAGRDVVSFGAMSSWSMVLLGIPSSIGVIVPLALFASGVSVGADGRRGGSRDAVAIVVAGVVAFAVAGFLAPWLGKAMAAMIHDPVSASTFQTLIGWREESRRLIAASTSGHPGLPWMIPVARLSYYQPLFAGLMGALMAAVGLEVGRATREDTAPMVRAWMLAFPVVGTTVALMNLAVSLAIEHEVAPALALLPVIAPAALVLLTLYWVKVGRRALPSSSKPHFRQA
jgi:hypothetical protein